MTDDPQPVSDPRTLGVFTVVRREGRPLPVILHERDGHTLFVRELDPGEVLKPIRFHPGVDRVVLMKPIAATRLCLGPEEGADDALTHDTRVVPDGQEGSTVYMRTLRFGEADDGRRVHRKPGQRVAFRPGSLAIELDALDEHFASYAEGYAPLTNTVWTWLSLARQERDASSVRYVLAAARRLDAAAITWSRVTDLFAALEAMPEGSVGPRTRATAFELIALVELAIIALCRVVDMVGRAERVGASVPIPAVVVRLSPDLKAIRDAFEHIDERATGKVRGEPHPQATSAFDQTRLLTQQVITYADLEVHAGDVGELLTSCRQFFKDVVRPA